MDKVYLGDGVYAIYDGYELKLTAENGITVSNTIFLNPDIFRNLVYYMHHGK